MSNPNYAPNPKKQQVYRNLQNKKLSDVTAKDIQQLTDPTFIQATNQDALITYNIINKAMMRDGSPMPDTQKLIQTTYTSTTDDAIFFRPEKGEVWQLVGGDTLASGGTGSIQWQLRNDAGVICLLFQTSVSGQEPIGQNSTNNNLMQPIYISNTNYLYADISAVVTSVRATLSFIRVR